MGVTTVQSSLQSSKEDRGGLNLESLARSIVGDRSASSIG
jgi:hypothetical protein